MEVDGSGSRLNVQELMASDTFAEAITGAIRQSLIPYGNELTALREELSALREEVLAGKAKTAALETSVRPILEEREMLKPAGATTAATPAASAAAAASPAMHQPTRQQLPHPEPFDGKDRALFMPWKTSILAKLGIEGDVIGDHKAQFYYVHNRLTGKALQMVTAYIEGAQKKHTYNPQEFIEYLTAIYDDPNKRERATNELNTLRQGKNVPFSRFLPLFEKLLAEAGGLDWPDVNKINALKFTLHPDLRDAFAAVKPPTVFEEYVSELLGLASRKEAARATTTPWHTRQTRNSTPTTSTTRPDPNAMDWEPSVHAAAIKEENKTLVGKRAKWVTKEEMAKRRTEHRCLRCGRKGCGVRRCPLLPAVKPVPAANVSVNTAAVEEN